MSEITQKYLEIVKKRNPGEPEFHQAVEEVLESLEPVFEKYPEFVESGVVERLLEPDRQIIFKVPWIDDNGKSRVNRGFRVQFNNALGPYKGGIRFHPSVNLGIIKFLGFEQIFKNSLTTLPLGGGKGGSDFDPKGKSDAEIMRFCQSYMTELYKYIDADTDVPAGDLGVGAREIGYMFGQYKRLTNKWEGVLTGKGVGWGGSLARTEATGYGIVYFVENMLRAHGETIKGKTVAVSGFGNVAWGTVSKVNQLGGKVVTISGPDGYVYDEEGISGEKVDYLLQLRASNNDIVAPYAERFPGAKFYPGERPWGVKVDIAIPCATQNEVDLEDAKNIVANGTKFYCEGSNMPTSLDALKHLQENNVIVGPAKAANAGGVSVSALEMTQNSMRLQWSAEEVDQKLQTIMASIFNSCQSAAKEFGMEGNYVAGANIAGFLKVAKAMLAQGVV
ncbi:MAG: NADP-specific glutamate dehydrogenase [Clostridiales bacterium]|nr:NADP-specific glutamate dehydrogenase [Clostridiales bacterium]